MAAALHASSCNVDKMRPRVTGSDADADADANVNANASTDAADADADADADVGSISCRSAEAFPPLETSYK
ncbi:hypothetical protein JCM24511_00656 [Saitozyma sp. JCM 24511]|nr:hypothetical protein JCM24511_00656 [Saitozyma sp. JCM 24511]